MFTTMLNFFGLSESDVLDHKLRASKTKIADGNRVPAEWDWREEMPECVGPIED